MTSALPSTELTAQSSAELEAKQKLQGEPSERCGYPNTALIAYHSRERLAGI